MMADTDDSTSVRVAVRLVIICNTLTSLPLFSLLCSPVIQLQTWEKSTVSLFMSPAELEIELLYYKG